MRQGDASLATRASGEENGVTVAVVVKVFDGLVLASDSATTMPLGNGSHQVWNNANKIFHLHRHHPIGAMTWGIGSIGSASVEAIAKDFRRRLMGRDPDHPEAELPADYTIEAVARVLSDLTYDELYVANGSVEPETPGLLVAGYCHDSKSSEAWVIPPATKDNRPPVHQAVGPDQSGWVAFAQDEASNRLFLGHDPRLPAELQRRLAPEDWAKISDIFTDRTFMRQPVAAPMPFADALNFARYLVDVTVGYSHYLWGPDTVGGPVEVAGITRHEGFKWVSRKHYYRQELNPEEPRHGY